MIVLTGLAFHVASVQKVHSFSPINLVVSTVQMDTKIGGNLLLLALFHSHSSTSL